MRTSRDFAVLAALISRRLRAKFKENLPRASISPTEWIALLWISEAGGEMQQRDLADCLDLTEGPATRLVRHLTAKGLACQVVSEHDRRSRRVRLTSAADDYVRIGEKVGDRLRNQVFDAVAPEDLETALKVLRLLVQRLS